MRWVTQVRREESLEGDADVHTLRGTGINTNVAQGNGRAPAARPDRTAELPSVESGAGGMKLVLAIVGEEDAKGVTEALTAARFWVTRLNTAGGFLRKGNETLLVGTEASRVPVVLRVLEGVCQERTEYLLPALPEALMGVTGLAPLEVSVGGATVFVLEVRQYVRL